MAQQRGRGDGRPGGRRAPGSADRPASRERAGAPPRERAGAQPRERGVDLPRLRQAVTAVVGEAGYDLEELSVRRVGRRYLVRVAVDSDAGVDLDRVSELSRKISARLDAVEAGGRELVPGEYELEVGSPGVDRPLTAPRHWRRNRDRLVEVRAAGRQVTGRVRSVDGDGVELDIDGTVHRFGFPDLGPGRVCVEFTRPGGPDSDDDLTDLADFDGADGIDDEGEDEE